MKSSIQHSWGLERREQWKCFGSSLSLPGISPLSWEGAPRRNLSPPQPSLHPLTCPEHGAGVGTHRGAPWGLSPIHPWPLPRASPGEHTHHAHTDTQSLYTRDIPRKKHLIHPLNNSDNSVLSPIYMFQTRYRCYENIANIQKYIHLKTKQTPYKLLTIAIR